MSILPQKSLVLVLLMALLVACDSLPWQEAESTPTPVPTVIARGVVSAEGRLVPVYSSTLAFESGGELGELLAGEGDTVAEGDVLARLASREPLEAALNQANLELLSAQQALDELSETAGLAREQARQALVEARIALREAQRALDLLDTDEFRQELDDRNIAVRDAQEELDDAADDLDSYQNLDRDNAIRREAQTTYDDALRAYNDAVYERDTLQHQLDEAEALVELAVASGDEAQRQFDNRSDGPDPDSLQLAEARLALATAQVAAAQRALDSADLTAPYAGTVVDLNGWEPGEMVAPGVPVVTLADFSSWMVETRDLTELDVVRVKPGQEVEVTPDALPDLQLAGTVESISGLYGERSGDILYTVRIRLDEGDPRLRWGMTVNAVFEP